MLTGIVTRQLKRFQDERGFFTEIFRNDWKDLLGEDNVIQANLSITYPNIIRAWHRHARGQIDYFLNLKGAIKICAYDEKTRGLNEIVSAGQDLQIVRIPGNYWHGFKVLGNEPTWLLYFANKLYDYKNPDEKRRPWNDPSIVPKSINGRKDDPRVGKPWDWTLLPSR
jgi:dTDP-4-dehydrorhamnose 3,5-epimerase